MIRSSFAALGLWALATLSIASGPVEGAKAQTADPGQAGMKDAIEAINNARATTIAALAAAPLGFRRILFVADVPQAFAVYEPRANNVFKSGDSLIIYSEPIGIAWKQEGDKFASKLIVDFEIRTTGGQVLGGQRGFGEFAFVTREPSIDYMAQVKLNLGGAAAGSYVLGLTIRDTNSGEIASTDLPFEIE